MRFSCEIKKGRLMAPFFCVRFIMVSELAAYWQHAKKPDYESIPAASLRLFAENDFLAIIVAAPAELAFFIQKNFKCVARQCF